MSPIVPHHHGRRKFLGQVAASGAAFVDLRRGANRAETGSGGNAPTECTVRLSAPPMARGLLRQGCAARQDEFFATLANDFMVVSVSRRSARIEAITNRITGQKFALKGDQSGFHCLDGSPEGLEWLADSLRAHRLTTTVEDDGNCARVTFFEDLGALRVSLVYSLERTHFWVERRLILESPAKPVELERVVYGRLQIEGARLKTLELGKFDRPVIAAVGQGGVFAGVGFWFYRIDGEGNYQNAATALKVDGRFAAEPWYLGVFQAEPGEPYPGWLWYRHFLEIRKADWDRQSHWSYWNAGWGQWGIELDDPSAPPYIELAHRLGIRSIAFGSGLYGRGLAAYAELAKTSEAAGKNLAALRRNGIEAGFLDSGDLSRKWEQAAVLEDKLRVLQRAAGAGFGAIHFDFFSTVDSYRAHRNVAACFRSARALSAYTECHLGMAAYGPEFQREVPVNHPADLQGFDLSHFSSDWTTFLGFRKSRSEWQRQFQYLMPEGGLYYFLTHYSNWGHARRYVDPEPQQFLYGPHAYCSIAYNFHDRIGFRESVAAASAFSPYYVFGHLDLKMPEPDVSFAREFQEWIAENVDILRSGRVCLEDERSCVISKVRNGSGCIYVVNYGPGERELRLLLQELPEGLVRQVYPIRGEGVRVRSGEPLRIRAKGESVLILDVNEGLKTLPPENAGNLRIDLPDWERTGSEWKTRVTVPDIRKRLLAGRDPGLPRKLLSIDQAGSEDSRSREVGTTLGKGKLPARFLEVYGFQGDTVETWKIVPWAFADRVWFVFSPSKPHRLVDKIPELRVNGTRTPVLPRVDYRPAQVNDWLCPLYFADVTEQCRYGQTNEIVFGAEAKERGSTYLISAANRER
jgi:hypothetical protein